VSHQSAVAGFPGPGCGVNGYPCPVQPPPPGN
jgi:hypothetical protein